MSHRIGVLLSGRGSNFEALADSIAAERIPGAEIVLVISNREDAPGLARAAARAIPSQVIPSKGLQREAYDNQANPKDAHRFLAHMIRDPFDKRYAGASEHRDYANGKSQP